MNHKFIRYSLGFITLGLIISAIILSKIALFILSLVFIICTLTEYRLMSKLKNIEIYYFIPEIIGIILAYLYIYNKLEWVTPVLVAGIFMTFLYTIITNKKPYMLNSFSTIMGFIFIFCTLYIVKLFYVYPQDNMKIILTYILTVMVGDFAASKIGPKFKNKLLSPQISPNKTVAGSVSNLFFSCIVCCCLIPIFKVWQCLLLGIIISIFSQIGDLTISLIKRDLGIKHSSNLFLDYGGILDRVDAFIFSAPAAYYCILFILLFK